MDFNEGNSYSGNMVWGDYIGYVNFTAVYAGDTNDHAFSGLVITQNSSTTPSGGPFTVSGTVKNTATQASPNLVYTITTFYNASGTVVGINMTGAPVKLTGVAPGETFAFESKPKDWSLIHSEITSYSVVVQSEEFTAPSSSPSSETASPSPAASQSPSSSSASPSGSEQPTQSPGNVQNALAPELVYGLIGGIVILLVVVVAVFLRKRHK
jgi:hypothetical protein